MPTETRIKAVLSGDSLSFTAQEKVDKSKSSRSKTRLHMVLFSLLKHRQASHLACNDQSRGKGRELLSSGGSSKQGNVRYLFTCSS